MILYGSPGDGGAALACFAVDELQDERSSGHNPGAPREEIPTHKHAHKDERSFA